MTSLSRFVLALIYLQLCTMAAPLTLALRHPKSWKYHKSNQLHGFAAWPQDHFSVGSAHHMQGSIRRSVITRHLPQPSRQKEVTDLEISLRALFDTTTDGSLTVS